MPSLQQGDIITIKLMSGEEVLAKLIEITQDSIKISKPRAVVNIPNKGIGLGPFVFTVPQNADVEIYKNNIVCFTETEDGMARQYREGTTGLTLPK
jgi:hypothetical protein|tara:strand:+ start:2441 stop:2728 length:288 start_codon:yes stop_codon:yes gene_type:complete